MISHSALLIRKLCCSMTLLLVVTACSSQPPAPTPPNKSQVSSTADRAAAIALQQVGVPYRYGGATPKGFDCSGLVHYSWAKAGKSVPRTTSSLWHYTQPVPADRIRKGDILFFRISGKMSHVGMYIGGGQFVHAPSTGSSVAVADLRSDFYRQAFIRAGRPE